MKKLLLLLLLTIPLCSFAQSPSVVYKSIWHKLSDRFKYGLLDSTTIRIMVFENQFKKLDAVAKCYIYPDTIYYSDGYTATGQSVTIAHEENELQIGSWTYYYPSGKVYSRGEFGLAGITECQSGGPSALYYSFKTDLWKYWYENGQLLTAGSYVPRKIAFENNCGTDTVLQSAMSREWVFYDSVGNSMENLKRDVITEIDELHQGTFYLGVLRLQRNIKGSGRTD